MSTSGPTFDTGRTVLRRALVGGLIVTAAIGIVAGLAGLLLSGLGGLASGLLGAGFALVFLGVTIVGLLLASRTLAGPNPGPAFVIVLGSWFLKVILFIAAMVLLSHQPWVQPMVLFVALVVAVLAFLVLDAVVVARARIPVGSIEH